jgi:hypothetical protein
VLRISGRRSALGLFFQMEPPMDADKHGNLVFFDTKPYELAWFLEVFVHFCNFLTFFDSF